MEILLAKHAGACYGVQRALDIAEEVAAGEADASTLGPLIHNPEVVASLESRGITQVDTLGDINTATVIIRSHGITLPDKEALNERDVHVVDATCPYVARAQQAAADLGDAGLSVLVVGEAGHPEVEGLLTYAQGAGAQAVCVLDPQGIPDDLGDEVGIVVQTTQRRDTLDAILDALRRRGIKPVLKDTICQATRMRQVAAEKLAREVDAMVIIGGRNSSNTTRLFEICAAVCPLTFHIESASELDPSAFAHVERVGVSAGASTPEYQIKDVIAALKCF